MKISVVSSLKFFLFALSLVGTPAFATGHYLSPFDCGLSGWHLGERIETKIKLESFYKGTPLEDSQFAKNVWRGNLNLRNGAAASILVSLIPAIEGHNSKANYTYTLTVGTPENERSKASAQGIVSTKADFFSVVLIANSDKVTSEDPLSGTYLGLHCKVVNDK